MVSARSIVSRKGRRERDVIGTISYESAHSLLETAALLNISHIAALALARWVRRGSKSKEMAKNMGVSSCKDMLFIHVDGYRWQLHVRNRAASAQRPAEWEGPLRNRRNSARHKVPSGSPPSGAKLE